MNDPKLSSDQAEQIINLLRDNPGVSQSLSDIADATGLSIEEVAAHMVELADNGPLLHDVTPDGVDVYHFPAEYQRGST